MKMKKYAWLILLLAICAALLVSCTESGESTATEISSAKIKNDKDTVVVEATLGADYLEAHGGEEIYLLSLSSCNTDVISSAEVLGQAKVKQSLHFKFSLSDNKLSAASAFILARKTGGAETDRATYEAVSEIEYISNPEILAATGVSPEASNSLKGLDTDSLTDAARLGADKVIIEINLEKFILEGYREGAINYSFGGKSFYFDKTAVEELDGKISEAGLLGLRVYLRSLLGAPTESTPEFLYCSGASKNAEYYCVNMADKRAADATRAFYSFIGSRYSHKESLAIDHIIGKTVNQNTRNCNAGSAEDAEFYALYSAWARVAYNAAASFNSNAKVYIPIDNSLHVEGAGIGAKAFLATFGAEAVKSGNYGFGIALDLGEGGDLGALLSGNATDYMSIGVGNLDSLTSLLDADELRFHGVRRDIIIDSLSLDSNISEANRAAYYVCAYYKAAEAGFDALFYDGDKLYNGEGKPDALYSAIRLCGDKSTDALVSVAKKMPCGQDLKLKEHISQRLTYEEEASLEIGRGSLSNEKKLSVDLSSFICGGSAYNADVSSETSIFGSRSETLTVSADATAGASFITCSSLPCKEIVESGYLALEMKASHTLRVTVILSSDSDKNPIYIGNATVYPTEKTFYFDIKEFTDDVKSSDGLTLTVVVPEGDEGAFELTLTKLLLYGSSGNGLSTTLTALGVFAATLAVCGVLFLLTRRRKRRTDNER